MSIQRVLAEDASVVHPSSYSSATNSSSETKACATQGEVADEVPDQSYELYDGREDRQ